MGWTRRDAARYFQGMIEERYRRIGLLVKQERLRQGLTHELLAAKAELSVKTVSRVENGRLHETRPTTYRKLAKALGVPVATFMAPLFEGADTPPIDGLDDTEAFERELEEAARISEQQSGSSEQTPRARPPKAQGH